MTNILSSMWSRTKACDVPKPRDKVARIALGIVNFVFFGVGTIVAGTYS